jgi:dTDP-4-dehydrorhamnose 3,5-epimerase|tara:strand:- start:502 stop:1083 length:582 start_codon:yes stop_codon:yes gene_type:complete
MEVRKFSMSGLLELKPGKFEDERGEFIETFKSSKLKEIGITDEFLQDNQSVSKKGVFRGIHLQTGDSAQGKLVRVSKGAVVDFAVDLRPGSSSYGEWTYILLSAHVGNQFWIPAGFGHAFLALEDDTIFSYKCTKEYDKSSEECLLWTDKGINLTIDKSILLQFGISDILVSEKDKEGITLDEYSKKYNIFVK